jgi:D-alanyl-D-alanine carboxypeptidase
MQDAFAMAGGRSIQRFWAGLLPVVLAIAMISPFIRPAAAAPVNAEIVVDEATGQVLSQSNADATTYPASLTKMMTLYLLFEALQNGKVRLDQPLPVSVNAARKPATNLSLTPGETITVSQAISGMIIRSANDAATVVAEALAGSEAAFAAKMNARALALGMTRTFFRNPNGLPDPLQHTTARDMARLAMALHRDFPQYYPRFAEIRFILDGRVYFTHNRFTLRYPGADGLKTGYIHLSGFNLATSAVRNGRRLFAVVLGGRSPSLRDAQMWALLDQGFGTATPKTQNNNALLLAANTSPGLIPSLKPEDEGDSDGEGEGAEATDGDANGMAALPQRIAGMAVPAAKADTLSAPATSPAPAQASASQPAAPVQPTVKPVVVASAAPTAAIIAAAPTSAGAPLPTLKPAVAAEPAGVADGVVSMAVNGNRFWGIQVGAYSRYSPARLAAVRAQQKLPIEIRSSRIAVDETPSPSGKMYYRARLVGMAQSEAVDACRQLKARQVSCLVVQSRVAVAMSGE